MNPGVPWLQDLGSLGELVAAIATIATLVYLAIQIRRNTDAVRASAFQAYQEIRNDFINSVLEPDLSELYIRGMQSRSDLTAAERVRFDLLMMKLFLGLESLRYQLQNASIGPEHIASAREVLRRYFRHQGVSQWWEARAIPFSDTFTRFVEAQIESGNPGNSAA